MSDLQKITDRLAGSLKRAVFVDDASFRPLSSSAQIGRIDDARVQALLDRSPTQQHLRYFADCGVNDAREPLRIPASSEQGLLPRVMIPVTAGSRVLARIWLIDADPPVSDQEIARVIAAFREIRPHLLGRSEATRHSVAAGSELLHDIRDAGKDRRKALFQKLSDGYGIRDLECTYACVVSLLTHRSEQLEAAAEAGDPTLLNGVLDTFIELLDAYAVVGYAAGGDLIALLSTHETDRVPTERISAAAHHAATLHDLSVNAIGVGGAVGSTEGFCSSLRQAEFAAKIAKRVPDLNGSACWDDLGEYRLFYSVNWSVAGVASINPGVASLIAERRTPLAATLLAYLEREGDVDATAAALRVHRTTLYYRIERAKEVLGEDPTGPAGFGIHAALRLADLAGLCGPSRRS